MGVNKKFDNFLDVLDNIGQGLVNSAEILRGINNSDLLIESEIRKADSEQLVYGLTVFREIKDEIFQLEEALDEFQDLEGEDGLDEIFYDITLAARNLFGYIWQKGNDFTIDILVDTYPSDVHGEFINWITFWTLCFRGEDEFQLAYNSNIMSSMANVVQKMILFIDKAYEDELPFCLEEEIQKFSSNILEVYSNTVIECFDFDEEQSINEDLVEECSSILENLLDVLSDTIDCLDVYL